MPVLSELKGRVPVKMWTDAAKVDSATLDQLKNTASLPFVFRHVAAMPDVHLGIGATVGSVVATRGAVIPAAVGVDIGCGMMALKTSLPAGRVHRKAAAVRADIEQAVPVGYRGNATESASARRWNRWGDTRHSPFMDRALIDKAMRQMGSLGGGNHFIEICLDEEETVWVMLHSGSRNVGKTLAERHINEAKDLMKRMTIHLPDRNLAYLTQGTAEFAAYLRDLNWCQDYALQNRIEMMERIKNLLRKRFGEFTISMEVNCHHNYAATETHFGEEVIVTRKGAVRARRGDLGIIPGSMGVRSFIVRGLGNPESFHSCAHGAGRRMSRTAAKKKFTLKDLAAQTHGVECRKDGGVLDEIPGAYKDIDEVMANQSDLVEVVAALKQFICVKG
ncbi:MAG: RtcB family protein [SAR324 cluster bacterium]|nr:RtcB family protein [SAR324 cluster bacterium]